MLRLSTILLACLLAVSGCASDGTSPPQGDGKPRPPDANTLPRDASGDVAHTLENCAPYPDSPRGSVVVYCCDFCPHKADGNHAGVYAMGADGKCLPFCTPCLPEGFVSCQPPAPGDLIDAGP